MYDIPELVAKGKLPVLTESEMNFLSWIERGENPPKTQVLTFI